MPGKGNYSGAYGSSDVGDSAVGASPGCDGCEETGPCRCFTWRTEGGRGFAAYRVGEFADHHAVESEMCLRWFPQDAGQVAKTEGALGYTNMGVHPPFHRDFLRKQVAAGTDTPGWPQTNPARPR